jgi:SAM-dependent methyltransferase
MNSLISTALANPRLKTVKRVIPRAIKRFLLLHVFGVDQTPATSPSRRWLECELLPTLPKIGFRRALFVGTAPYTWHYERIARRAGGEWITCDISPGAAVWGARRHVVTDICEIDSHFAAGYFDAVIVNGVLAFGINTEAQLKAAVSAIWRTLRPDGLLILGWDSDAIVDPLNSQIIRDLFCAAANLPFASRRVFEAEAFVYDFQVRSGRDRPPC